MSSISFADYDGEARSTPENLVGDEEIPLSKLTFEGMKLDESMASFSFKTDTKRVLVREEYNSGEDHRQVSR